MENLIKELYYGNICPAEQMGKITPEVSAIMKRDTLPHMSIGAVWIKNCPCLEDYALQTRADLRRSAGFGEGVPPTGLSNFLKPCKPFF